jgi:hypothetical protein
VHGQTASLRDDNLDVDAAGPERRNRCTPSGERRLDAHNVFDRPAGR